MILWKCLPRAAWQVHHMEPILWTLEHGAVWVFDNTGDFGRCVRTQAEDGRPAGFDSPDTPRGARSASVIEQKFSAYLRKYGCTGNGPDDCTTLLHSLVSLSPRHPDLPLIAKQLALNFLPHSEAALPAPLKGKRRNLTKSEYAVATTARRDLMRQVIFLETWLTIDQQDPAQSMPPTEAKDLLTRLMQLTRDLGELDGIQATLYPQPRIDSQRTFANPGVHVADAAHTNTKWREALDSLALDVARNPGCGLADLPSESTLPAALWLTYGVEKLVREGRDCNVLPTKEINDIYQSGAADPTALQRIEGLRLLLGNEKRARGHNTVIQMLGAQCPRAFDPWRVCAWVAEGKVQRLTQSQRRLYLRKEDVFSAQSLAPQEGIERTQVQQIATVLKSVHSLRPKAEARVAARLKELAQRHELWFKNIWTHTKHPLTAIEFEIQSNVKNETHRDAGASEEEVAGTALLVFGQTQLNLIALPGGWGQYDDGTIAAMTDIDGDSRLEVWFKSESGECDGEDSKPGIDCAVESFQLGGEVFGNTLSTYIKGPPPASTR